MGGSVNSTNFLDDILLHSFMDSLQIRRPERRSAFTAPPFAAPQSLEDLFFSDNLFNFSDSDSDGEDEFPSSSKTQLAKEESKLKKEIIRTILSGKSEILKANSGQAVMIREHHICVSCIDETESAIRVWEWHGHIMLMDEQGFTPEYIYGNYLERLNTAKMQTKEDKKESDDCDVKRKVRNVGLKELIEPEDSRAARILHQNLNANSASTRFI